MVFINSFEGFETGDLRMATATSGTPDVSTAVPVHSGDWSCKLIASDAYTFAGEYAASGASSTQGGLSQKYTMHLHFTDSTPTTPFVFARISEQSLVATHGELRLASNGDIELLDDTGSVVATLPAPFTDSEWATLEWRFRRSTGTLANARMEVKVNGDSPVVVADLLLNGTDAASSNILTIIGPASGEGTLTIDDIIATAFADDYFGLDEIKIVAYQQDQPSVTSGSGLTSNDLDADGNWANVGETPGGETNIHTWDAGSLDVEDGAVIFDEGANSNGHAGGPSTGAPHDVSGTILAAMFVTWSKRDSGSGASHEIWMGNSGTTPLTVSPNMALGTAYAIRAFPTTDPNLVPTASEDFAMGGGAANTDAGGRDHQVASLWGMLLHVFELDENRYGRPSGHIGATQMQQLLAT